MSVFYRLHQFWLALFPRIQSAELKWLESILNPASLSLFYRQSVADQRHALDVAQDIAVYQTQLTKADYQALLSAALLHDCGKSRQAVRIWHRVFIVIMQKMPSSAWSYIERLPTPLAVPLKLSTYHADWSADLVADIGLNAQVCALIREHHQPTSQLGYLLFEADNRN